MSKNPFDKDIFGDIFGDSPLDKNILVNKRKKSDLDKQLEDRRRKTDGDFEHKITCCKNRWKILLYDPLTYAIVLGAIFCVVCYGVYYEWKWIEMIGDGSKCFFSSLLTGLIQYRIIEKNRKS